MTQDDIFGTTREDPGTAGDVGHLASRVISVLCERQAQTASGARQYLRDYIIRAVLHDHGFDVHQALAELRGHRLTLDQIIDIYVPEAAMELGEMWMRSEASFAAVTIASIRLQALLGEASSECLPHAAAGRADRAALAVISRGEQHFLGIHVVAAQLRRMGFEVRLSFWEEDAVILERVQQERPELVAFSWARVEALDVIAGTVNVLRQGMSPAPVLALGGNLKGDAGRIREKTGVDLITRDVREVVSFCTKRQKALSRT